MLACGRKARFPGNGTKQNGLIAVGSAILAMPFPMLGECAGEALCSECFWWRGNGGYCAGCDSAYQVRCLKRLCAFSCYTCSGGRHAHVPGCCGRASAAWPSWREQLKQLLDYQLPEYSPRPLHIRSRLIPVIYPQIRKYNIPQQFPEIDAWAVPIHKVASRKGKFRADNLKDYLGLPPDRKLILSTCAPDDYQEMLWKNGPQIDYKRHGIDYWFPAHFSIYDDDSKLYQFVNAKRQQLHAVWSESQFVWFRRGEHIPVDFLKPIRNAPSVLISTNQMYWERNRTILHNEVRIADCWFPPETAFLVVGGTRDLPIPGNRPCFEINSTWLTRGLRGHNLARQREDNLTIAELLRQNLRETLANVGPAVS